MDRLGGRCHGGIVWLVRQAVAHPGELAADFREFFHVGVGGTTNRELWLLMRQLMADPRSRFQAAIAGWQHPSSWAEIIAMDTFDFAAALHLREKFKPYERPWVKPKAPPKAKRKRTAEEALAVLRPQSARIPPVE